MKKVYLIIKVKMFENIFETSTEVFATREQRDAAWQDLVKLHNEMIADAYELDLNSDYSGEFYYEWNSSELEFYNINDPELHRDYYKKDIAYIEEVDNA